MEWLATLSPILLMSMLVFVFYHGIAMMEILYSALFAKKSSLSGTYSDVCDLILGADNE